MQSGDSSTRRSQSYFRRHVRSHRVCDSGAQRLLNVGVRGMFVISSVSPRENNSLADAICDYICGALAEDKANPPTDRGTVAWWLRQSQDDNREVS